MKKYESDHCQVLAAKVKEVVSEILSLAERPRENYSVYISNRLNLNYTYVANVFSETEGITIEHYIIEERIKMAITLLESGFYSISEIAQMLMYSSIGHFSNQFKKVTGKRPSTFLADEPGISVDKLRAVS
jgi:YesN/AraC family two-component response regulator